MYIKNPQINAYVSESRSLYDANWYRNFSVRSSIPRSKINQFIYVPKINTDSVGVCIRNVVATLVDQIVAVLLPI